MSGRDPEPPPEPPSSGDELLQRWERRIDAAGDPLAALAEVLGGRAARRERLFQRVGDVVLGYRLTAILGAGGMGVTYSGTAADGSDVAVKLVPGVGGGENRRFAQECRVLQELRHPAIVRYRDHAVLEDGTGVLCMERVRGVDLEHVLLGLQAEQPTGPAAALVEGIDAHPAERRRSPRFQRRVLRLLAEVADGLHTAHVAGVVHRDVKPANVLVRDDLSPVLIDFGLARDHQVRVSFTASGAAMGTLAYMAPEQLGGDRGTVDARADVYALGLVLFEALCGEPVRADVADVLADRARPFLLRARDSRALPVPLQAVLYRCLDPRPQRRYPTAADLASDLRAAAGQGTVRARRPSAVRRFARDRRRVGLLTAALLATAAGAAAWWWPGGRHVVFVANCSGADARVVLADGREVLLDQPVWLPLGPFVARLVGDGLREHRVEGDVAPGEEAQQVVFTTQQLAQAQPEFLVPGRAVVQFTTGHSWIASAPGLPLDRRWIDEVEVHNPSPLVPEGVLAPGRHVFAAVDGRGRREAQTLDIGTAPTDVQLLPAVLADVGGSFRRTWSTVFSPLPDDLELHGDPSRWFGRPAPSVVGGGGLQAVPCALVPRVANRATTVELRCRFPEPMRSAVAFLRVGEERGGSVRLEAAFDGEAMAAWPRAADGRLADRAAFVSTRGALGFTVRARLLADIVEVRDLALARFLDGMLFGGHWRDEPPCFAIAADPGGAAVLPAPHVAFAPHDAPACEASVVVVDGAAGAATLTPLPRPGGGHDLLATVARPDAGRALWRIAWPSAECRAVWEPDARDGRSSYDGRTFAEQVVAIADLDGDGVGEIVLGDRSSERRGAIDSGSVDCVATGSGRLVWSWPTTPPESPYGDDSAGGRLAAAGDWDGDGDEDLLVSVFGAPARDGAHRAGATVALDAISGREIWRQRGVHAHEELGIVDVLVTRPGQPAVLVQEARQRSQDGGTTHGRRLSVHVGGAGGRVIGAMQLGPRAAAILVRGAAGAPSLVVVRLGEEQDGFVGIERFAVRENGLELRARLPLQLAADEHGALERLGDVDGDGTTDVALRLGGGPEGTGVFCVSGRELTPVRWCALPVSDDPGWRPMVWLPARAGRGGGELVVATRSAAGLELRVFRLP